MGNTGYPRARRGTLAGTIVDGHELVRVIGSGGMGEVYLARHLRLGLQRAIKVIRSGHRGDPVAAERFAREAHVLARLQHNSIIQIVEFGELDNGWPYFVMEYVEGPNLDQVIAGVGPMRLPDALAVLEQIANALVHAHELGVIHRDLKPANVLLRGGDLRQVKVIDFGLARMLSEDTISRLTAEGQMLGSPLYMAPEQAAGKTEVTPAVDSYALAGVAYTLISGQPVFPLGSALELIAAHATDTPPRLRARCPDVPSLLDDLLFACLSKEPELRPRADELASHLARLARKIESVVGLGDTAADVRKATMARPQPRDSELARVLRQPPQDNGTGVSDALVNQAIAVLSELAAALSAHDAPIAQLYEQLTRASAAIDEIEMNIVMVDARRDDSPPELRGALDRERLSLEERAAGLRAQVVETRYQLANKLESLRAQADPATRTLFGEIDRVLVQLRSLGGTSA